MLFFMNKSYPANISSNQGSSNLRLTTLAMMTLIMTAMTACSQNAPVSSTVETQANAQTSTQTMSAVDTQADTSADTDKVDAKVASASTAKPAHIEKYQAIITQTYQQMTDAIKSDDVNTAFVKSMIVHHQGAVAMSYAQLKFGQDSQIRDFAQSAIDLQQEEIAWMKDWLINHANQPATTAQSDEMQAELMKKTQSNYQEMIDDVADDNPDAAYIKAMILHHKTAIKMANTAIKHGADADITALAEQIKTVHSQEIEQMKDWLKSHK